MSKEHIGFWLLISLIPTGIITFIAFIERVGPSWDSTAAGATAPAGGTVWAALFVPFAVYWWGALFGGLLLRYLAKRETENYSRKEWAIDFGVISMHVLGVEVEPPPTVAIAISRSPGGGLLQLWHTVEAHQRGLKADVALELTRNHLQALSDMVQQSLVDRQR